jgi:hypothetical protein
MMNNVIHEAIVSVPDRNVVRILKFVHEELMRVSLDRLLHVPQHVRLDDVVMGM